MHVSADFVVLDLNAQLDDAEQGLDLKHAPNGDQVHVGCIHSLGLQMVSKCMVSAQSGLLRASSSGQRVVSGASHQ